MIEFAALNITVLAGGISHEREVSLRSGRRVADALSSVGHKATLLDLRSGILSTLIDARPDVIWPALHGATGEDGALLALLETTGIPHVGSRGPASALAWSKPTAKEIVRRAGYSTPDSIALSKETFRDLGAGSVLEGVLSTLGTALVVKPAQGGSAQGVTIVEAAAGLPRGMVDAYAYADVALVEKRVIGTELAVTVIEQGDQTMTLPAVEIVPRNGVYSFEARYNAGETQFYAPARISPAISARVESAALGIHALLGLRHLSRIDMIVDAEGTPWFLEANTLPGLTETSLVPQSIAASGQRLGDVYARLASAAVAVS